MSRLHGTVTAYKFASLQNGQMNSLTSLKTVLPTRRWTTFWSVRCLLSLRKPPVKMRVSVDSAALRHAGEEGLEKS